MDRSKIILSSIAGVTLVVCLLFVSLGVRANGEANEVSEARDKAVRSIGKVYKEGDPFPSRENVAAVRANAERMEALRASLTNKLAAQNIPVRQLTPSVFVQMLRKISLAKIDNAPIVDGKKVVDPDFAFGFERYIGANPSMPKEGDIPRLLQQLYVVDELVDVLYGAQVARLLSIDRVVFESSAETVAEEAPSRRGSRRAAKPSRKAAKAAPSDRTHEHFSVRFQARQEAAVAFVNGLSKLRFFVLITDISFQKVGTDIRLPGGLEEPGSEEGPRRGRSSRRSRSERSESAEPAAAAVPSVSKLPPGQRLLAGAEIDPLIAVTVEFDVYSFAKGGK